MSSVAATNPSPDTANVNATSKAGNSFKFSPDDFMTMFLAQLHNQNPMQPMDSSTILQQMATMGSMSATADMQEKMDSLTQTFQNTMGNSQVLAATQLIGKKVEVESAVSPLTQNGDQSLSLTGSVELPGAATGVTVTITDPTGKNVVATLPLGTASGGGLMDFSWNGLDANGKPVPAGYYNISASATISGKQVPIKTAGAFDVKSVALGSDGVILNLDGIGGQNMGSILKIL